MALKNVSLQKSIFVDIFISFNPNRGMGINGGYFPAICRVFLIFFILSSDFVYLFCPLPTSWVQYAVSRLLPVLYIRGGGGARGQNIFNGLIDGVIDDTSCKIARCSKAMSKQR